MKAAAHRRTGWPLLLPLLLSPLALHSQTGAAPNPPAASKTSSAQAASTTAPGAPGKISNHRRNQAARLYARGAKALDGGDPRAAQADFAQAAELDPENRDYATAREIARQHRLTQLVQEADKARLLGHEDQARAQLAEALAIDPSSAIVAQHIGQLADLAAASSDSSAVTVETLAPPIEFAPRPARQSFHLRTGARELLRQVYEGYGISITLDDSVRQQPVRLDADDVDFAKAVKLVSLVTRTFAVPLDPRRALLAQDTRENREKYQRTAVETVYLPGLSAPEVTDAGNVVRSVFDVQQALAQPDQGTLTIRAPQATLKAVNVTLGDLLEGRSQVMLQLRLYEVARTRARNIGVQLPQQLTLFNVPTEINKIISANQSLVNQIISSGLAAPGDLQTIALLLLASGALSGSILSQPFATFGGGLTQTGLVPGPVTAHLSLNTSDVRSLNQADLRVQDQEAATIRSGTRYPIVTSTFSSLPTTGLNIPGITTPGLSSSLQNLGINLAGAVPQQTIPQVQYEDLGLTLKATPRVQQSGEVQLALDFKIQALGGGTLDGNPILNNRQFTGTITVRNGESAVLISNLTRQESKAVSGVPGLSELPGFHSTTNKQTEQDVSSLVLLITPRVVRRSHPAAAGSLVMLPQH